MLPLLPLFVAAASSMTIKPTLRTANGILHVDPKKHVKLNNLIEEPLIISLSRLSLKPLLTEMRADTGIISKWPHGVADALDCGSSLSRVCLVSIARCLSVWKAPCEGGESICLPGQRYTGSRRSCSFCRYRAMTTPVTELARSVIEEREVLIVFNSIILNPCVTIFLNCVYVTASLDQFFAEPFQKIQTRGQRCVPGSFISLHPVPAFAVAPLECRTQNTSPLDSLPSP